MADRIVLDEIATERRRQLEVEGWTPEHDDKHSARRNGQGLGLLRDRSGLGRSRPDTRQPQGMDAGARHQVSECVKAIAALSPLPAEPTDGWIEWKGGECSLPDGLEIDVKYGDGRIYRTSHPDGVAGWAWAVRDILAWARIIAYRIVKPAEPSAPVAEDE